MSESATTPTTSPHSLAADAAATRPEKTATLTITRNAPDDVQDRWVRVFIDEGDEEMAEAMEGDAGEEREERDDRRERSRGRDRDQRRRYSREERNSDDRDEQEPQPTLNGGDSLPLDVLPPAIGADTVVPMPTEEAASPRPRRRARVARPAEGEDDVAPAA